MGAKRKKNGIYERGDKATEETTSEWHLPQEEDGKHSIKKREKVLKDFSQGVGLRINNVTLW